MLGASGIVTTTVNGSRIIFPRWTFGRPIELQFIPVMSKITVRVIISYHYGKRLGFPYFECFLSCFRVSRPMTA